MSATGATVPNLIVAGVEKAGTTSLFSYLGQHPDVCGSTEKELNHFAPVAEPGGSPPSLDRYAEFFGHCRDERYLLEASPSYWYLGAPVVAVLAQTLKPRIILSFREPVARMWSAFTYLKSMGRLDRRESLDDYIARCQRVHQHGWDTGETHRHTPLSVGRYGDYVGPWLEAFDDHDLRIVFAEHLFADPGASVGRLCEWLDLDPTPVATFDYETRNETIHPRSRMLARVADSARRANLPALQRRTGLRRAVRRAYAAMNTGQPADVLGEGARRWLEEYYRPSNAALAERLRQRGYTELPSWLLVTSPRA